MHLATWIPLLGVPLAIAFVVWQVRRKDWFPARRRRTIALFSMAATALLLAIAQPTVTGQRGAAPTVIFVGDASPSMRFGQPWPEAAQWVRQELPPDTEMGLVAFSGAAQVSIPPGRTLPAALPAAAQPTTNIDQALRAAMTLATDPRRTVLLLYSDGYETEGQAFAAATEARERGFHLFTLPPAKKVPPDAAIVDVRYRGPLEADVVPAGSQGFIDVVVRANVDGQAEVTLQGDLGAAAESSGGIVPRQSVTLKADQDQTVSFGPLEFKTPGYRAMAAAIKMPGDQVPENDSWTLGLQVGQKKPILFVRYAPKGAGHPASVTPPLPGTPIREIDESELPDSAAGFGPYAAVVLLDVPAYALSSRSLAALAEYVGDMGGGLVALGGDSSFGLGGYTDTPLDDILPLKSEPEDRPPVELMLLVDRSASMAEPDNSGWKLARAKEAVLQIATLLGAKDHVGVTVFNHQFEPLVSGLDKKHWEQLQSALGPVRPTGGTELGPPLMAALEALSHTPQEAPDGQKVRRHIIVVTDGQVVKESGEAPFDVAAMVAKAKATGATVSLVLTSKAGAWTGLEQLAIASGGKFYDISAGIVSPTGGNVLARILLEDLPLPILQKEPVAVTLRDREPLWLHDQLPIIFPPLPQHLITEAKKRAWVNLATVPASATDRESDHMAASGHGTPVQKERPVLATWPYGLGRAVAWPIPWAEATSPWTSLPLVKEAYRTSIEWAARGPVAEADYDVTISATGGRLAVRVTERRLPGALAFVPEMALSLAGGSEKPQKFTLEPHEPGVWELEQTIPAGAYAYALTASPPQPESGEGPKTARLVRQGTLSTGPSAEFRRLDNNERFLAQLAAEGGGEMFNSPEDARRLTIAGTRPSELWPYLLALGGLLVLYATLRDFFTRVRS